MTPKAHSSDPFIFILLGEFLSSSEEHTDELRPFSTGAVVLLMILAGLLFFLYSFNYGVLAHYL